MQLMDGDLGGCQVIVAQAVPGVRVHERQGLAFIQCRGS